MRFLVYFLPNYKQQIIQSGMVYGAVRIPNTSYSVAKDFVVSYVRSILMKGEHSTRSDVHLKIKKK